MIRIGLFQNFKGADTVLIEGAPNDIEALSRSLGEVVAGKAFAMHEVADVAPRHPVVLFVASASPGSKVLWWKCSREEIEDVQGKLEPLAQGEKGHQYFDLEGTDVQLMISVGEYGPSWWHEHG